MIPLPEGNSRKIKGQSLLGDYDLLPAGNKVVPYRVQVSSVTN